jgi:hypothetical protein
MGITQEDIVHNAQTVTKGLEALRLEHQSLLGGLRFVEKQPIARISFPLDQDGPVCRRFAAVPRADPAIVGYNAGAEKCFNCLLFVWFFLPKNFHFVYAPEGLFAQSNRLCLK